MGLYDLLRRRVRGVWAGPVRGRMDLRVDVSGLPAGLYLLRARGATVSATRTLVVAR